MPVDLAVMGFCRTATISREISSRRRLIADRHLEPEVIGLWQPPRHPVF